MKTVEGAFGIIINSKKILLTKRGYPPYKNKWAIPGGKIEKGELPSQTVIREVKEEINVDTDILRFFGKYSFFDNFTKYVLYCFILKLNDVENIVPGSDTVSAKWFKLEKLPLDDVAPIVRDITKDFKDKWI
jgi:8-oxo-dGTP diphosphatase